MATIVTNTRVLAAPLSGVQRYATELLSRFRQHVDIIAPRGRATGLAGHAWEQLVLPRYVHGRLLWSPSNSGPLAVRRQVVTVHDLQPFDHPEWLAPRYARWYRWVLPRLVARVRAVIVDSSFTRDRLARWCDIDPARVHVIPLGVSEHFIPAAAGEIAEMRRALGISPGPYVLTLSTVDRRRNVATLLRAWAVVTRSHPTATLVLAGASPEGRIFGDAPMPSMPERVQWTGRVDERLLPALYSGAAAFAFMSEYEGFGLPVIEAMACGTPVIGAAATALPETMGDGGVLTDPYDAHALARTMIRFLEDEQYRVVWSAAGLARAKTLSWDTCASRTMEVLDRSG